MKESAVASHVRLYAAQQCIELFRNNNGAFQDEKTRRWIRYGLCNDSSALNKRIKSSDLIGITPKFITTEMVGTIAGIFTAIETKPFDWKHLPSDERANAQKAFHDMVRFSGGYAGFTTCIEDFKRIVKL